MMINKIIAIMTWSICEGKTRTIVAMVNVTFIFHLYIFLRQSKALAKFDLRNASKNDKNNCLEYSVLQKYVSVS